MVLAIGLFVSAALGPSDLILVASGRIRYLVVGNLSVTVLNVALLLFLVPRFGALGAAIATVVAQLAQRTYEQVGLRDTPVRRFRAANGRLYITVAAAASGLWAISHWLDPGPLISLALVGTLVMMTIRLGAAPMTRSPPYAYEGVGLVSNAVGGLRRMPCCRHGPWSDRPSV
ncbi:MAG: polysaccharide biosynthesis C-terminal domain-containing protein [Chloroflexi bacterium]|nr:polysaccharide biosynthesis C-terminal domain-containing protein [Chloroflexota bacterium]